MLRIVLCAVGLSFIVSPIVSQPCPEDFCAKVTCPKFDKCDYFLQNVTACGCCDICINYVKDNERCGPVIEEELTWPSSKPRKHCKPNYYCVNGKCIIGRKPPTENGTTCLDDLEQFLNEVQLGWRHIGKTMPECDAEGNYKPRRCLPGSLCYCVDREGKRIFGEMRPEKSSENDCRCSRQLTDLMDVVSWTSLDSWIEDPLEHFLRCDANGDYDKLQCLENQCFCINDELKQDGKEKARKIFRQLHCYNMNTHSEYYIRDCEKEKKVIQDQMKAATKKRMLLVGFELPDCDPDGSYAPKRCTNDTCFCADKYGFKIDAIYEVPRFSDEAEEMNCYCAREQLFLRENRMGKKVNCSPGTGNYARGQCLGALCYCVDDEGHQITSEINEADLDVDIQIYCEGLSYVTTPQA